jgi:hypothetical protein
MTQLFDNEAHPEAGQTRSLLLMPVTDGGDRDASDAHDFIRGKLRIAEGATQTHDEQAANYLS